MPRLPIPFAALLLLACGGADETVHPADPGPIRDFEPAVALDGGAPDALLDAGPPVLDAEPLDGALDGEPDPERDGGPDAGPDEGLPVECPDDMVLVPAGDFPFGRDGELRDLPDFCVDVTEVPAGAYLDCVDDGACDGYAAWEMCIAGEERRPHQCRDDRLDHPANWIDWYRAEQYCRWAGKRLPHEGHWEKAARGPQGSTYPWGEGVDCRKAHVARAAPFDACLGVDGLPDLPVEVHAYGDVPSPYGAINLVGNVREWLDLRIDREVLPPEDEMGIAKGGDWRSSFDQVMNSDRDGTLAVSRSSRGHGFRCILELP